jgi:NTE family protein
MADMQHTLAHPHWFAAPDPEQPFVTHDVHCTGTQEVHRFSHSPPLPSGED